MGRLAEARIGDKLQAAQHWGEVALDGGRAQAATALATALDRYVTCGAWAVERDLAELPETASVRRRALHQILRLNSGKTWGLSSRTIDNVLKGERGAE